MRAKALPKNAYLPVLLSARRVVVLDSLPAPGGDNPDVLTRRGCRLGRAPWGIGGKAAGGVPEALGEAQVSPTGSGESIPSGKRCQATIGKGRTKRVASQR